MTLFLEITVPCVLDEGEAGPGVSGAGLSAILIIASDWCKHCSNAASGSSEMVLRHSIVPFRRHARKSVPGVQIKTLKRERPRPVLLEYSSRRSATNARAEFNLIIGAAY